LPMWVFAAAIEIIVFVFFKRETDAARQAMLEDALIAGLLPISIGILAPPWLCLLAALPELFYLMEWDARAGRGKKRNRNPPDPSPSIFFKSLGIVNKRKKRLAECSKP